MSHPLTTMRNPFHDGTGRTSSRGFTCTLTDPDDGLPACDSAVMCDCYRCPRHGGHPTMTACHQMPAKAAA